MTESALQKAERQLAQAKARLQALRNREALAERKADTRRKVILGGALLDLATRDSSAAAMVDRLLRNLPRDRDRAAFDGWSLGTGATGGGSDKANTEASGSDPAAGRDGEVDGAMSAAPVAPSVADWDHPGGARDDLGQSGDPHEENRS